MTNFNSLYAFQLSGAVREKEEVRVLDRATEEIINPAELSAKEFFKLIEELEKSEEKHCKRFDVWVIEETEETEDE